MKYRNKHLFIGALLAGFGVAACAGTQPNAVQKGYPKAQLHPLDLTDCRDAGLDEKCIDKRNLAIDHRYSGLADDGFRNAKTHEAYETRREQRRNERNRGD